MADTPKLVSSMGRAELDRIFVRGYDLNRELLGKINSRSARGSPCVWCPRASRSWVVRWAVWRTWGKKSADRSREVSRRS